MSKFAAFLQQNRLLSISLTAAVIGAFAVMFQIFVLEGPHLLAPWQTGALVAAITLWTRHGIESNLLARARLGRTWATFLASSFAQGYPWGAMMFLMLANPDDMLLFWLVYGVTGLLFGAVMTYMARPEAARVLDDVYTEDHILDGGGWARAIFVLWPVAAYGMVVLLILNTPEGGWTQGYIPGQIAVYAAIWPSAYTVKPAYKRTQLVAVALGLALFLAVLFL